jgi:hypothetical protein
MSALTSLLVRDGVVPVRKIEEALQRQVISGGDVETVLLEMDALPENVLAGYRAALLELTPATREEVMEVRPDVVALVPPEVAVEHRVIPLALEGRTLHVAVHHPLSPEQEDRLGFLLGFDLVPHVTVELRIAAGLAHHYGAELTPRMARLIDKVRAREAGAPPDVGRVAGGKLAGHAGDIPVKDAPVESVEPVPYARRRRSSSGMLLEPAPPESEPPPQASEPSTVGPRSAPPGAFAAPSSEPPAPKRERPRTVTSPGMGAAPAPTPSAPPQAEPTPRRSPSLTSLRRLRGPLTLAGGERLLRQATDRDQILEIFFAFARQFFDYTALFVVQDDVADGRVSYGSGAGPHEVQAVTVPLDRPSAFSEARRTLSSQVRRLDRTDVDRDIAVALRRPAAPPAMIMPIAIRQRVVLILYGDRDGEDFDIGAVMELVRFGPRVVEAFEQLILRLKRAGYHREEAREPEAEEERASLKEAARSVSRTAGSALPSRRPRDSGEWHPGRRSSPPFAPQAGGESAADDSWGSVERAPKRVDPSRLDPPAHAVIDPPPRFDPDAPPSAVLGIPRQAPPPPAARLDLGDDGVDEDEPALSVEAADEPDLTVEVGDDEDEPDLTIEVGDDEDEPDLTIEVGDDEDDAGLGEGLEDVEDLEAPGGEDRGPEIAASDGAERGRRRPEGMYSLRDASVEVVRPVKPESRPRSGGRAKSRGPRDPRRDDDDDGGGARPEVVRVPDGIRSEPPRAPPTGLDADTRSVIVDMGDQVHAQVEDLLHARSPGRREELLRGLLSLGEAALPVLAQAFPGPLTWRREAGGRVPRAAEVSPIAAALVAFGERAAPYVSGLLSSAHPDVRFYAAVVASELVHPELMDAVAERIHDEDPGVRRIAVQLLPRFAGFRGFDEIRTVVRRTARIRGKDLSRRWQAVDAVAALRDVQMLPKLIELLKEDDDELIEHLQRALVALTCADFGHSLRRWRAWWERNRDRHRIEWLIDGLTHGDEDVRRLAGEEIKRLTQEYYGYHPGSPKRDRERVAKKYRRWWEQEGQRRFAST